jgi:hypothetical protein
MPDPYHFPKKGKIWAGIITPSSPKEDLKIKRAFGLFDRDTLHRMGVDHRDFYSATPSPSLKNQGIEILCQDNIYHL